MNNLQDAILKKIEAGEVAMRPRWRFLLETSLWIIGVFLVLMATVYLGSFVLFVLRQSGVLFVPQFGWSGFIFFLLAAPWLLMCFTMIFATVLYVLVTHFAFSYRHPLVYSLLGVVGVVAVVSLALHILALHDRIEKISERYEMPIMSPWYRTNMPNRPEGLAVGSVLEETEDGFILLTEKGETVIVRLTPRTKLLMPRERLLEVEELFVVGRYDKERTLEAFGVREAGDDLPHRPVPRASRASSTNNIPVYTY